MLLEPLEFRQLEVAQVVLEVAEALRCIKQRVAGLPAEDEGISRDREEI